MNQELLNKYIAGDATPEEKEEVARWLDTDKKNMKEFLALRKLYDISIWQQEANSNLSGKLKVVFAFSQTFVPSVSVSSARCPGVTKIVSNMLL